MRGFVVIMVPKEVASQVNGQVSQETLMSSSVVTPVISENEEQAGKMAMENNPDYIITGIMSYELLTHLTGLVTTLASENGIEIDVVTQ